MCTIKYTTHIHYIFRIKQEIINSIDKINSKIKLNYFGKQVSFSKKVFEIENEEEEIENDTQKINLTPERIKNNSTIYKKQKNI